MKVKMLTGMAGANFSLSPGDPHECDDAEGGRLIKAGHAEPWTDRVPTTATEKAVKKGPAETR